MKPPFKMTYDEAGDVLYITGSDNRPATAVEPEDGILLRYADDNRELVGITILYPGGSRRAPDSL